MGISIASIVNKAIGDSDEISSLRREIATLRVQLEAVHSNNCALHAQLREYKERMERESPQKRSWLERVTSVMAGNRGGPAQQS